MEEGRRLMASVVGAVVPKGRQFRAWEAEAGEHLWHHSLAWEEVVVENSSEPESQCSASGEAEEVRQESQHW